MSTAESASACVCGQAPHAPWCGSPEAFAERTEGATLAICVAGHTTVFDAARETPCAALVSVPELERGNGRRRCGARIAGQRERRPITLPLDRDCLCCGGLRPDKTAGCEACGLSLTEVEELNRGMLDRHFGSWRDPDRFVV